MGHIATCEPVRMATKSAEEILREIAERTGWNTESKLQLALAYIEAQSSTLTWRDFLEHHANEEGTIEEDLIDG